jgi:hypothetical protein
MSLASISIIPCGLVVLWSLFRHCCCCYRISYALVVIVTPFVYCCQYAFINIYVDSACGLYEAIVVYCLFLLLMQRFENKAAFMTRTDVSFPHRDKCLINETFKDKNRNHLFSLYFGHDASMILVMLRLAIGQYISVRLLMGIIVLAYHPTPATSILNHLSLFVAVVALFFFLRVTNHVLWIYDGSMKCILVGVTAILLYYQSLILSPAVQTITVGIEMFFITLFNMWIFPYDEEKQTSLIFDSSEIT